MTVIMDVTVPAEDFELGRSLQPTEAGARCELERMIPTTDRIVPYFWVYDTDAKTLEATLSADENVLEATLLDEYDDQALFRIAWPTDVDELVQILNHHEAAILEAIGTSHRWNFQLRFPDTADISAFRADCEQASVRLNLKRLYHPSEPENDASGLTPLQRETLLSALEAGYFDIPRRITTEELAETLGISDQALNERLRRGHSTILTSLLVAEASN
jgi:predicted DNA binding protein